MPERVDVLIETPAGKRMEILGALEQCLPAEALDEQVRATAREVGLRTAVVTFIGQHSQRFAASVGLPDDLSALGGTDRSVSICQYVVRDGHTVQVQDLAQEGRLPQALVKGVGLRSYLGAPVRVNGTTLGALCVLSDKPTAYSAEQRALLERRTGRVSELLQQAYDERGHRTPLDALSLSALPAFGELRNVLGPLQSAFSFAIAQSAEVQLALRGTETEPTRERSRELLADTQRAAAELHGLLLELPEMAKRLQRTLFALEALLNLPQRAVRVEQAVEMAMVVSEHYTKLVGGVTVALDPSDAATPAPIQLGRALAAALCRRAEQLCEERRSDGLALSVIGSGPHLQVKLTSAGWSAEKVHLTRALAQSALGGDGSVQVAAEAGALLFTVHGPG